MPQLIPYIINQSEKPYHNKTDYGEQKTFTELVCNLHQMLSSSYGELTIDKIAFYCYTPGFNDGDVCEYTVECTAHSVYVNELANRCEILIDEDEDSYTYDPDALEFLNSKVVYNNSRYFTTNKPKINSKAVYTNPSPESFTSNNYMNVLYETFGDYVHIVVSLQNDVVVFDVNDAEAPY